MEVPSYGTAEIQHPTIPEVVVVIRRLGRVKTEEALAIWNRGMRIQQVSSPEGVPATITRDDGTIAALTERVLDRPISTLVAAAEPFIVDIRGLTRNGAAINYNNGERRGVLEVLVEPEFNVDATRDGKEVKTSFLDYIFTKAMTPATFGISSGKA
jgi:hypothetical protein